MMDGTDDAIAGILKRRGSSEGSEIHATRREAGNVPARIPSRRLDFLRGHLFAGGAALTERGGLQMHDYAMLALLQLTSMGTEAVILFFVLSGFAMAHSLSRSGSPVGFYQKRVIRIWPPYLAGVILAFAIAAVIQQSPEPNVVTAAVNERNWDWRQAVSMALYIKVGTVLTGQFWSLPHEVLFYALCPLILATYSRVLASWVVAGVLTFAGIMLFGVHYNPTGGAVLHHFVFTLLVFFLTGALAYHHQHRIPRMGGRALLIVFLASFVAIWFMKYRVFGGWNIISSLLIAPIAVLLIGNVPPSLYERKWLNWGHFSYSLYVFHMQILVVISYVLARIWGLEQPAMTSYWMWMLAVPPVIAVCWLLYLAVEKRCDAALTRIRDRERAARVQVSNPVGGGQSGP